MFVPNRMKRFRPFKVYIFLISIASQIDGLASERCDLRNYKIEIRLRFHITYSFASDSAKVFLSECAAPTLTHTSCTL